MKAKKCCEGKPLQHVALSKCGQPTAKVGHLGLIGGIYFIDYQQFTQSNPGVFEGVYYM